MLPFMLPSILSALKNPDSDSIPDILTQHEHNIILGSSITIGTMFTFLFAFSMFNSYKVLYKMGKYKVPLISFFYLTAIMDILCIGTMLATSLVEDSECSTIDSTASYMHSFINLSLGII
jgi:hypothetical protein